MPSLPKVSDAEWEVLRVLWGQGELSAAAIVSALDATTAWKPTTVRTLLSRLVKKRAIGFRPAVGGYVYFALVTETQCAALERQTFLQKVYQGDPRSMLAAFLTEEHLSPREIEELRQLLDDRSPGK